MKRFSFATIALAFVGAQGRVTYHKYGGKACRTYHNGFGIKGKDFRLYHSTSEQQCKHKCSNDNNCNGFEWGRNGRCEIWYTTPEKFEWRHGYNCHVKDRHHVIPSPAPTRPTPEPTPVLTPGPAPGPTPLPTTTPTVYHKYGGKACRTYHNGFGIKGKDFRLYHSTSEEQCKRKCSTDHNCNGFEWSHFDHGRCEIWYTKPEKFEWRHGFNCHVKVIL